MRKTNKKNKINSKRRKIIFLTSITFVIFVLFVLYSVWSPSSQIFGKTIYKNSNSSVSLTFDDGPGPETEQILDILKKNNITATFFITCEHINSDEVSIIKKMSNEGNIVAIHGLNHNYFQKYKDIKQCKELLENITETQVVYFRPPYGLRLPSTMNAAKKLNLTVVTWSLFSKDYRAESPEQIINRVERNLKSNSIICFHDGPAGRENTVKALPKIINYLQQNNFKISNIN